MYSLNFFFKECIQNLTIKTLSWQRIDEMMVCDLCLKQYGDQISFETGYVIKSGLVNLYTKRNCLQKCLMYYWHVIMTSNFFQCA